MPKLRELRRYFAELNCDPRYPAMFPYGDAVAVVVGPGNFRVYALYWGGVLAAARAGISDVGGRAILRAVKRAGFKVYPEPLAAEL